jgi:SSS family solute:Na+ symporter
MLLAAYGAVVQLAPPVYAAFLWRRATAVGVVAGLLAGILVTAAQIIANWRPYGLHEGVLGLTANIITLVVISLASDPPESSHVSEWIATSRQAD